ncbi:helix-turn-helix transcriptional regulator [Leekyejoonella antrihumi]|uniref:Transcriptional regulator n=1 Tax=Leekyejoonella antrihumi TaxID=1660198 RepID=A0A563E5A9_9MICO|nr:helix-turn-helix domain-containing protein [Leekyejoonella antrihumi]TWP37696.1 transcriptional regulator [Leekyejoonella antrihumi]
MREPQLSQVAALAVLDEPTRRRLYEHVIRQVDPVSRDEVAGELGVARATVAFHLDKLVDEGLLDVSYARRTGRSGPGAGRPAKLYRRSKRDLAVSLPERRYDLVGRLLASAIEESERTGQSARGLLAQQAYDAGVQLGEGAGPDQNSAAEPGRLLRVLEEHGFEPRRDGADLLLGNCPFHVLAQTHTDLVCGMNLDLMCGLLRGLGDTGMHARLDPAPDRCCVRLAADPPT